VKADDHDVGDFRVVDERGFNLGLSGLHGGAASGRPKSTRGSPA
jgi:hypothetical protein